MPSAEFFSIGPDVRRIILHRQLARSGQHGITHGGSVFTHTRVFHDLIDEGFSCLSQSGRVSDRNMLFATLDGYRLEFFRPHDGSHPVMRGRMSAVADYAGKADQIFTGRANGTNTALSFYILLDDIPGFYRIFALEVLAIANLGGAIVDIHITQPFS